MKKLALLAILLAAPAVADEPALEKFVPATDGARACWAASFPDRPAGQKVTEMALSMQVADDPDNDRMLWNFELAATQVDAPRASGIGNCLGGEPGAPISCGIECDGGGVYVTLLESGNVSVDLETAGFIRLLACGTDGDRVVLEAGPFDKTYELAALPAEQCPEVINPGDDLSGVD